MLGTTVLHYRVLESLGSGGMGDVYLAEDTRLGRKVALKLLRAQVTWDDSARKRFVREARAAARLDHPHICAVYDIDEADDGRLLIAMAYCEGETLKARIGRGRLPVSDAVDVACQIADGLSEAHAHQVVHRDIKPANVIVTSTGRAKIVDFGVAHLPQSEQLTTTGLSIGTPAYMSPEQARGEEADARTDLWALGVMLYEMLTGQLPFAGDGIHGILYAIVNRTFEPLDRLRPELPADLVRIINRALVKDPIGRYQHAEQMLADLRSCRERLSRGSAHAPATGDRPPSIAVLPFANLGPEKEQDYFCDGMTEELISALGMLEGMRVAAHTSTFQLKGQGLSIRQIGERLGIDAVVEGSVRKAGDRLRITAQLVNVSDGYHLWSERFDRRLDDVFAVQDEIARAIVDKLKVRLKTAPGAAAGRSRSAAPEVYELYLKGRYYFARRSRGLAEPAVDCFRRATQLDPDFAPAHAGLADALSVSTTMGSLPHRDALQPAREAAERAVALDEALPEAHHALAMVHCWLDWNWDIVEREFLRALALNSNLPLTRAYYALALTTTDRIDEVKDQIQLGLALDPLSPIQLWLSSMSFIGIREYDRALSNAEKMLELEPESVLGLQARGCALSRLGKHQDAIDTLTRCVALAKPPYFLTHLGVALALAGRAEAGKVLGDLLERAERELEIWGAAAWVQTAMGDLEAGLTSLDRAMNDGFRPAPTVFADSSFDLYRRDPRFAALLRSIGYTGTALLTRGVPNPGPR